ncbi:hypothetical protein H1230_16425 [Paenibacillus sp. 19GGS1-52]|uniref:hypothetical protein n=1 Tax=Paenibacillus sp. 19GGS1-52 TaxID=2758563 RepID=UPI001EFAD222|nr:hypothetical protein [Paenibacillus sp. 19GGS1-52]ULO04749.1 hypothetical protein H1230_16425 [Paenibacillus sp. 19GGS1-52]
MKSSKLMSFIIKLTAMILILGLLKFCTWQDNKSDFKERYNTWKLQHNEYPKNKNFVENQIKLWEQKVHTNYIDVEDLNDFNGFLSVIDPFDWNSLSYQNKRNIVYLNYEVNRWHLNNYPFNYSIDDEAPESLIIQGIAAVDDKAEEYNQTFDSSEILNDFCPHYR